MNTLKTILLTLVVAVSAFAQMNPMTQTTLVLPTDANQLTINLASITGITAPGAFGQTRTYLYVDSEMMTVQSLIGTSVTVIRGVNGTRSSAHNAAAVVYVGPASYFSGAVPQGACTAADWPVTPRIVPATGQIFLCTGGVWVDQNAGGGGGLDPGSNGIVVRTGAGTAAARAIIGGTGVTCTNGDGVAGNPTCSADTAVIATRAGQQAGTDTYCAPSSASGSAYVCAVTPALGSYTSGQRLAFRADAASGSTPTLDAGAGAKRIYASDGTSAPAFSSGDQDILVYDASLNAAAGAWRRMRGAASGATTYQQYFPFLVRNTGASSTTSMATFGASALTAREFGSGTNTPGNWGFQMATGAARTLYFNAGIPPGMTPSSYTIAVAAGLEISSSGTGTFVIAARAACSRGTSGAAAPVYGTTATANVTISTAGVQGLANITLTPGGTCAAGGPLIVEITRDTTTYPADTATDNVLAFGAWVVLQ